MTEPTDTPERGVTAGERAFWCRCADNGIVTAQDWLAEQLPDHPALPIVAAALHEAGDDAVAIVLSRDDWNWRLTREHFCECDTCKPIDESIRRQLDAQRAARGEGQG